MSKNENKPEVKVSQVIPTDTTKRQIVITLRPDGKVDAVGPTDMKVMFYMLGAFFQQLGMNLEFKTPSPIIQPPPGMVVKP